MRLLKLSLLSLPLIYLGVFATLTVNQRSLLYHRSVEAVAPAQAGLTDFKTLRVKTEDGETLVAWLRAPRNAAAPFIVYFHGNSGSLAERRNRFHGFAQHGYGVLAISWRGFGGSTGEPTEAGLLADAEAAYDEARRRVDAKRIVLIGESLGTGVATMLAARHEAAALVLDSPYDSILAVAGNHYPIFPVSLVLRDTFRADEAIGKVHIPVLMMLGEDDDIIPAAASRRLFERANPPKELWALPGVGHLAMSSPGALARTIAWIDALPRN